MHRRAISSTDLSALQSFVVCLRKASSFEAAINLLCCSKAWTVCSNSFPRCFTISAPLVLVQSLSSSPSSLRAWACTSSSKPVTLPWTSASFSRPSLSLAFSSTTMSSFLSMAATFLRSTSNCCSMLWTVLLTLSAIAATCCCGAPLLPRGVCRRRAAHGDGAPMLFPLLHMERLGVLCSITDAPASPNCFANLRTSTARARVPAGLADLPRPLSLNVRETAEACGMPQSLTTT
mmetsp:Transcript_44090/g.104328  ORF Transcript_44090/g.104328 Transcript_44090/m.104328 type:complete len:234 (+) Transcript_44090:1433-2134(+)